MATDLNHVVLVGRLTRDVGSDERSFGYVANGQARANLSIAVNRSRKDAASGNWVEEANFFEVTLWGKQAENLKPYLTKGKQIAVDGYLKQDRWQKDGQNFSRVTIVVMLGVHQTDSSQEAMISVRQIRLRLQISAVIPLEEQKVISLKIFLSNLE